jgi:hypothetical protein
MDREIIKKLERTVCKQLEEYSNINNMSGKVLEDVANLVKTAKNLSIIEGMEEEKQGGYSQRSYASYEDDMSMRRGRDSMGRYVSRDDGPSMRGGSYHDGGGQEMRQAVEEIKRKLDQMM